MNLFDFVADDEMVAEFATTVSPCFNTGYVLSHLIVKKEPEIKKQDILACMEETLHRLKEHGASDEEIFQITGMISGEEARKFIQEWEDGSSDAEGFVDVDLGYILPGLLVHLAPAA